jgi:hypothetical protein
MVNVFKEKWNERCASRSGCEMMESQVSHQTTELVAFHKRKRKFLNLKDLATEDRDQLVCELQNTNVTSLQL